MFHFLQARLATMLRTNRSLLRAARRHLMGVLRSKEETEKLLLPLLKQDVAAGDVEKLKHDLRKTELSMQKCYHTLDDIERDAFMAEYDVASDVRKLRDKLIQVERVLLKIEKQHNGIAGLDYGATLAKARQLLDRDLKASHDEMYDQYLAIQREAKGQWGQLQNFVFSVNEVMQAMDNLWNLRSDVRLEQREESAIEKEEDELLKLLFELDHELSQPKTDTRRTAALIKEIKRLFKEMDAKIANFTKLFEHSEKAFTLTLKVCVHIYFAFGKDKAFLIGVRDELKRTGFPEKELEEIDEQLKKGFLEEEADVKRILDVITRGSRLVANQ